MKAIIAFIIIGAVAVAGSNAATNPTPELLPPDKAKVMVNTGSVGPKTVSGAATTVEKALAAGKTVGANVESSPEPKSVCWWTGGLWHEWGTWPYQQRVTEERYWCATGYGGAQTYRVSHVRGGTTLCDWSNAYGYRIDGGNGYTWTTVRSGAHFDCPTSIPYITIHTDRWQDWACNTWGNCAGVRHS